MVLRETFCRCEKDKKKSYELQCINITSQVAWALAIAVCLVMAAVVLQNSFSEYTVSQTTTTVARSDFPVGKIQVL